MVWIAAGLAAAGAVLLGVVGMGMTGEPPKKDAGKEPVKVPATKPANPATTTPPEPVKPEEKPMPAEPLSFKVERIDGTLEDLARYKGKVVVIVNVASKCGFTEQYAGLQELYEKHKDAGLVVLGFPANDFGSQEPGTNLEVAAFCSSRFKVTFPMFEKIVVKGPDKHPLYGSLTAQPAPIGGDPRWNFTKFVLDRDGKVVARFDADKKYVGTRRIEPDLVKRVEELLSEQPTGTPASTPKPFPVDHSHTQKLP